MGVDLLETLVHRIFIAMASSIIELAERAFQALSRLPAEYAVWWIALLRDSPVRRHSGASRYVHCHSASGLPPPPGHDQTQRLYERATYTLQVHVVVETTLIISMIYVLAIKRSYDPAKR